MIKIVPAILPKSWGELEHGLARLVGVAPAVQVDVVNDIFAGREALPQWEEFDFEFDIYIEPAAFAPRAVELGAAGIVVHARHATARQALQFLQPYRSGDFATAVGLALRPSDTPAALDTYAGLYDYVQVMGINNEGHQGEPFDPRAIDTVRAVRAAHPGLPIQVDGHTAGHEDELAAAGATALVAGSVLAGASDPKAVYKEMYNKANAHR